MADPTHFDSQGATGLVLRESSIFERSSSGRVGFELPPLDVPRRTPVRYSRDQVAELPEVGELDVVRHFTRLSSWNYAIKIWERFRWVLAP